MKNNIVTRHSASTILFNVVNSYKQCGQHKIFNPVELQAHDFFPCTLSTLVPSSQDASVWSF